MDKEAKSARDINMGRMYPYDTDTYYEKLEDVPVENWERVAALGVIRDLSGRKGIKNQLGLIDDIEIRKDIVDSLEAIIHHSFKYYSGFNISEPIKGE